MKKYIPLLLCAISFHTMALGGFESLTETQQNVTKSIVNQLGVDDPDNTFKKEPFKNHPLKKTSIKRSLKKTF